MEDFSLTSGNDGVIIRNRIVTFSDTVSRKGMNFCEKDIPQGAAAAVLLDVPGDVHFGCTAGAGGGTGSMPGAFYICMQDLSCAKEIHDRSV